MIKKNIKFKQLRKEIRHFFTPFAVLKTFFQTPSFTISDKRAAEKVGSILYFPTPTQVIFSSSYDPQPLCHWTSVCYDVCEAFDTLSMLF